MHRCQRLKTEQDSVARNVDWKDLNTLRKILFSSVFILSSHSDTAPKKNRSQDPHCHPPPKITAKNVSQAYVTTLRTQWYFPLRERHFHSARPDHACHGSVLTHTCRGSAPSEKSPCRRAQAGAGSRDQFGGLRKRSPLSSVCKGEGSDSQQCGARLPVPRPVEGAAKPVCPVRPTAPDTLHANNPLQRHSAGGLSQSVCNLAKLYVLKQHVSPHFPED